MTDILDPEEVRRRAYAALESSGELLAELQAREMGLSALSAPKADCGAAPILRKSGMPVAEDRPAPVAPVEPPHPVRRPHREGRDWHAERLWIESIIDARVATLIEAIGLALAEERKTMRAELEAELVREREGVQRALAERLARLDRLLSERERSDAIIESLARANVGLQPN